MKIVFTKNSTLVIRTPNNMQSQSGMNIVVSKQHQHQQQQYRATIVTSFCTDKVEIRTWFYLFLAWDTLALSLLLSE